ncbi:MAG: PAS domain-containing protein [Bacteroidota bacterium]
MSVNKPTKTPGIVPLHCWDIFSLHLAKLNASHSKTNEHETLLSYQQQFDWQIDLEAVLNRPYQALVLTDPTVRIAWVSAGFTDMTGYSKYEVLGKSPNLLQGRNTSAASKASVRKNLSRRKTFEENLINYRKNGEEYICHVEIHPMLDAKGEVSHFLALESEAL